jgi:hypothetical protein
MPCLHAPALCIVYIVSKPTGSLQFKPLLECAEWFLQCPTARVVPRSVGQL